MKAMLVIRIKVAYEVLPQVFCYLVLKDSVWSIAGKLLTSMVICRSKISLMFS